MHCFLFKPLELVIYNNNMIITTTSNKLRSTFFEAMLKQTTNKL